jgi:DNA polymerase IV
LVLFKCPVVVLKGRRAGVYDDLNIFHIDMNTFFLAVELNLHPDLRKYKTAVAYSSESRSVILSASYEVRKSGVRAGMAVKLAKAKCPEMLLLEPHHELYGDISSGIHKILEAFSPECEMASIDEAFLDVKSTKKLFGNQIRIARAIKKKIWDQYKLTCSIGIAPNKLIAKMGSDMKKPDGLTVLTRQTFLQISKDMPADRIPGIGPKTYEELSLMNIRTMGDLRKYSVAVLRSRFGVYGDFLHEAANGIDHSGIMTEWEAKSIGQETTLEYDTDDRDILKSILMQLSEQVGRRLRKDGRAGKTVTIKVRYFDFRTFTMRQTVREPVTNDSDIYRIASILFERVLNKPVRLLGVTVSNLMEEPVDEPGLFDNVMIGKKKDLEKILDGIKDRFGESSVRKAGGLVTGRGKKIMPD